MRRLGLVLMVCLTACTPPRIYPGLCPDPARVIIPASPPPARLHTLRLASPSGGDGRLSLERTVWYVGAPRALMSCNEPGFKSESKDSGNGQITISDELATWRFTYVRLGLEIGGMALGIRVENRSNGTIELDWNSSALVDQAGQTHRIFHQGIRLAERSAVMPPSVIPSFAMLDDLVFPSDAIMAMTMGWVAIPFFENIKPGEEIRLVMSIKGVSGRSSRDFKFRADMP